MSLARRVVPALVLAFLASPLAACSASAGSADEPRSPDDESVASNDSALSIALPPPPAPAPAPAKIIPDTGAVDDLGNMALVLGKTSIAPVVFKVAQSAVKTIDSGFEVRGDLTIDTPAGPLTLAKGDLVFTWAANRADGLETLRGSVEVPAPGLGALSDFAGAASPVRATIGYDLGKNLLAAGVVAPILEDRKYLVFDYEAGLSASAGPISVAAPGGKAGTLVLDPQDPSFYLTGGLLGLDAVGPLSDMALGLSARGLLAFNPQTTWGVEDQAKPFTGHVYAKGKVSLARLPINIKGELVTSIDPTGKGRRIGEGTPEGVQLGANGTVNLGIDFLKVFTFEVPLGKATVGARITKNEHRAYVSGEIGPDAEWLPSPLPFVPESKARAAAYLDSNVAQSFFTAQAAFGLKVNKLYSLVPGMPNLGLKDIDIAEATLRADATGFRVSGKAATPFIPVIKPKGQLAFDAYVPEQPENFTMTMTGELAIVDFPLANASARLDKSGMRASGTFKTPLSSLAMAGSVDDQGASLEGTLKMNVRGAKDVVQKVTDGAVCGYDYVKDGSICGYETVRDGAICGTRTVQDAAVCGSRVVTSAAVCGTHAVTDGAVCGWDVLKSGWSCMKSGFKNCKAPKTCQVANSCRVANSCNVANTCTTARSCDKAKTCDTKVTVPDFDFGDFEGKLSVAARAGGATGSVSGKLCKNGSCTAVPSAKVTLGSQPRACIKGIPDAPAEICASF